VALGCSLGLQSGVFEGKRVGRGISIANATAIAPVDVGVGQSDICTFSRSTGYGTFYRQRRPIDRFQRRKRE